MIDWSKYPVLSMYRSGSMDAREELDRIRSDVQRAERERCAKVCRAIEQGTVTTARTCSEAIEALGDDDG